MTGKANMSLMGRTDSALGNMSLSHTDKFNISQAEADRRTHENIFYLVFRVQKHLNKAFDQFDFTSLTLILNSQHL